MKNRKKYRYSSVVSSVKNTGNNDCERDRLSSITMRSIKLLTSSDVIF
jgi:hypothetical protein